jgi:hypothetical protein
MVLSDADVLDDRDCEPKQRKIRLEFIDRAPYFYLNGSPAHFWIDEVARLNDAVRSARIDEAHCWSAKVAELEAKIARSEALENAMKIAEELDRRREERLRRLDLHERIGLGLTDEQCNAAIAAAGLAHLALVNYPHNKKLLHRLCREAVAAARGSK